MRRDPVTETHRDPVVIGMVDPCPLKDCPRDGQTHEHDRTDLRRSPTGREYLAKGGEK